MDTPTIAIVGAGPCGLTFARLLERKGIDYVIYERDGNAQSNNVGGSLDLHPGTGQLALRECGLWDEFMVSARYDDTIFTIADKLGNRLLELGQGRDAPEIDRAELRKLLLQSIPKDKIKWGHVLQDVGVGADGRRVLRFANGVVVSGFRLVLGADGAWSKVRSMTIKAKPYYTGKTNVVSTIHHQNPVFESLANKVKAGSHLSIGSGGYIMVQRQGDGSYRVSFGIQAPETLFCGNHFQLNDATSTRRILLEDFYQNWSKEYKTLIRHSADFRAWPLYTLSTDDMGWEPVRGVTLAGDAAHLAYPGGEGVNLAMMDALQLAAQIAEHGIENIDHAVQQYEADMFPRAVAAITKSKAMESVMYSDDPQAFIRFICT
ncbi:hypothetical protein GE09DRAFT_192462 [Coniochaeta sp. 2T2.1]|nr:hypothetical protein GE09DRAFT_192462 [Coniochaeta sp. 2T2.1]